MRSHWQKSDKEKMPAVTNQFTQYVCIDKNISGTHWSLSRTDFEKYAKMGTMEMEAKARYPSMTVVFSNWRRGGCQIAAANL